MIRAWHGLYTPSLVIVPPSLGPKRSHPASFLSWPLYLRPAYHDEVSSQDEGWQRSDFPPWSGEPAEDPDILEQGRDRPPTRWWSAGRWRRPPTVATILGAAGLLVGLAAGYAVGTLHAGKATVPSAQFSATASPILISPVLNGAAPGQVRLWCAAPAGANGTPQPLNTPVTIVPTATPHGTVISPSPGVSLTCRQ
jgi:hypothetical protein